MKNLSIAYLLVFHGSRYASAAIAASRLANLLTESLPNPLVSTAALELARLPLEDSIVDFAQVAIADGYETIRIIPLFLSQGVHVREDIPQAITQAKRKLGTTINLELAPYLGGSPEMAELLEQQSARIAPPTAKRILLAHGSRLAEGNRPYEIIAAKLNAINAYWSVPPDLNKVVQSLVINNSNTIEIILYFLFPGKITQAIANQVTELQSEFPHTNLILTPPLSSVISDQLSVNSFSLLPISH